MRNIGLLKAVFGVLVLVAARTVVAQSCATSGQYASIDSFSQTRGCLPGGYYQAQDVGQTTPSSLNSVCAARCSSSGSSCQAYVGQLFRAVDSGLYTGQCFFYSASSVPSGPAPCADAPATFVAGTKDNTLSCLSSSASLATQYCSSYLSIGTVTSYTSTVTPTRTVSSTTTLSISTTTTSTSKTTTTTVSTSTVLSVASTSTTQTSIITLATSTTATSTSTISTTTTTTTFTFSAAANNRKRATTSAGPPSCLTTSSVPASRLSSACSCLSIKSSTVFLVSTAPTTTTTRQSTTSKTSILTAVATSVSVAFSTTTTTSSSSTTISTTTTTTITSISSFGTTTSTTATSTVTSVISPIVTNGFMDGGISPWEDQGASNGQLSYITDNPQSPPGALAAELVTFEESPYSTFIQQSITLQLGQTYIATYWARLDTAKDNCVSGLQLNYRRTSRLPMVLHAATSNPDGQAVTTQWKQFTGPFTAPTQVYPDGTNVFTLVLTGSCDYSPGAASMIFDSISIVPVS